MAFRGVTVWVTQRSALVKDDDDPSTTQGELRVRTSLSAHPSPPHREAPVVRERTAVATGAHSAKKPAMENDSCSRMYNLTHKSIIPDPARFSNLPACKVPAIRFFWHSDMCSCNWLP